MKKPSQTSTAKSANRNSLKVFKALLGSYADVMFQLGAAAVTLKKEYGSKVIEIIGIDRDQFLKLYAIGRSAEKSKISLSPEHYYVVAGRNDADAWLREAKEKGWKPTQLRAAIRQANKVYKPDAPLAVKVSNLPKQIILLKNRLGRLPIEQRSAMLSLLSSP